MELWIAIAIAAGCLISGFFIGVHDASRHGPARRPGRDTTA